MEQYYAVVYCHDGTIHLWPGESQGACLEKLRKLRGNDKVRERMRSTTVIKRDMGNFRDGMIFGSPKSLNVMDARAK